MIRLALVTALCFTAGAAHAQSHPIYAGLEARSIKALSEQQVADLRVGRGMGLALAAELNGYPGPIHVLELKDGLSLTPEQGARMRQLSEAMRAETIPVGERLIAQEAELDRLFSGRTVTLQSLADATAAIGNTQATLRHAHLKYHLATVEALRPEQVRRYAELRGYAGEQPGSPQQGGHHRPH